MLSPQTNEADDFAAELDAENPWSAIEKQRDDMLRRAATHQSAAHAIHFGTGQNLSRVGELKEDLRNALNDLANHRKAAELGHDFRETTTYETGPDGHKRPVVTRTKLERIPAIESQIEGIKQEIEKLTAVAIRESALANALRDPCERLDTFRNQNKRAIPVAMPITAAERFDADALEAIRDAGEALRKQRHKLKSSPVSLDQALERCNAEIEREGKLAKPGVVGFINRKSKGGIAWPSKLTRREDHNILVNAPTGGPIACWLFPDAVRTELHKMIRARFEHRDKGLTSAELKSRLAKVEKQLWKNACDEEAMILAGSEIPRREGASIFPIFQFRVEGCNKLRGTETRESEAW